MIRQMTKSMRRAKPTKSPDWLRRGLLQSVLLLMTSGCAALSLDARTETTTTTTPEPLTEKTIPACGRLPGARTPDGKQVQKLGPYPEYGESQESLEDACRMAEDKAATSSDLYVSEYQSANWVCKKTIERTQRERYVRLWQCGVTVEIFCEYTLNCGT